MDISFIIVNWNTRDFLVGCLNSIEKHVKGYSFETFVVDNNSSDGSADLVEKLFHNKVSLIRNSENMGFAKANNQAIKLAKGRYCILLNSDTVLNKRTVSGLVNFLDSNSDAAMVGPRMTGENGKLQNSYDNFPALTTELLNKSILRILFPGRFSGKTLKADLPFEVDSLIGACIAIRTEAIKEVGVLDEDYFFFLEETDWCFRMRKAGWKIFHHPEIDIIHLQGQSKKLRPVLSWIEYYRSLYKYFKKNRSRVSYLCLRIFRLLKLVINFVLTFVGLLFTLGKKKRFREKTVIYFRILWWHLMLCPGHVGLKGKE